MEDNGGERPAGRCILGPTARPWQGDLEPGPGAKRGASSENGQPRPEAAPRPARGREAGGRRRPGGRPTNIMIHKRVTHQQNIQCECLLTSRPRAGSCDENPNVSSYNFELSLSRLNLGEYHSQVVRKDCRRLISVSIVKATFHRTVHTRRARSPASNGTQGTSELQTDENHDQLIWKSDTLGKSG